MGFIDTLTIVGNSVVWIKTDWIVGGQWYWEGARSNMHSWCWCGKIEFSLVDAMNLDTFLQEGHWKVEKRFNEH